MKLAAVVVLYNPPVGYIQNIRSYADHVTLLIVVDNTEIPGDPEYNALKEFNHLQIITNNENKGIAAAINDGIEFAVKEGYEWVLTMDQDSGFTSGMISRYLEFFGAMPGKELVAVVGPVHDKSVNPANEVYEVTGLITSGSFINTTIFKTVGGYNEKLFIDEVDLEYCYRSKLGGFKILEFSHIGMEHTLGKIKNVRTPRGREKAKNLHSPLRLYYIVRNCCYVIKKYKKHFPMEMKNKRKDLLVRIKNNLLYGNHRFESVRKMIRGYADYRRNRFGKYNG